MQRRPKIRIAGFLAVVMGVAFFLSTPAAAQDLSEDSEVQVNPKIQVLVRLDRNRDGILEQAEIPAEASLFVNSIVKKYVVESSPERSDRRPRRSESIDLVALKKAAFINDSADPDLNLVQTLDPSIWHIESEQLGRYSHTLINIYDQDRDGVLSVDEYQKLGPKFRKWDLDRDRKISAAEVTVRLRTLRESDSQISTTNSRLDAPATFSALDANADGQIQMHEFTSDWSDRSGSLFYQKDKNQDGIITLAEWLQHQVENEETSTKK